MRDPIAAARMRTLQQQIATAQRDLLWAQRDQAQAPPPPEPGADLAAWLEQYRAWFAAAGQQAVPGLAPAKPDQAKRKKG